MREGNGRNESRRIRNFAWFHIFSSRFSKCTWIWRSTTFLILGFILNSCQPPWYSNTPWYHQISLSTQSKFGPRLSFSLQFIHSQPFSFTSRSDVFVYWGRHTVDFWATLAWKYVMNDCENGMMMHAEVPQGENTLLSIAEWLFLFIWSQDILNS